MLHSLGRRKVGVLGLSFKSETDDLRQSPIVRVIEALVGRGFEIKAYDKNIDISRMLGANRQVVEEEIPYLSEVLGSSLDEVVRWAEVIVVANKSAEFHEVVKSLGNDRIIVDLVRIIDPQDAGEQYVGICW
jgi:GDP-mannose 6-dehydrogenase